VALLSLWGNPAMRDLGPRPTLGELQRSTPWVWPWCERCQHHAPLTCAVAVILWGQMLQAINCVPARAVRVVGAKVRPFNVRAEPEIISASIRFRLPQRRGLVSPDRYHFCYRTA